MEKEEIKFEIVPYQKDTIVDEHDLASAKQFLLQVKDVRNKIEAERKDITKPILDSKKKIDDKYKMMDEPFEQMEKQVKALMSQYLDRVELEAKKELGKDVAKLTVKEENVSFRIDYDVEVIDILKVSKDYLIITVDEQKVKKLAKEGQKTFAGLKVTEKKTIISR